MTDSTSEPQRLADNLDYALRSALRFAASRSAITSEQEKGILAALRTPAPAPSAGPLLGKSATIGDPASLQATPPAPAPSEAVVAAIVRDVAELPDRTSPDDWPEGMLVTQEELAQIVAERIASHEQARPQADLVGLLCGPNMMAGYRHWAAKQEKDVYAVDLTREEVESLIEHIAALAADQGEG